MTSKASTNTQRIVTDDYGRTTCLPPKVAGMSAIWRNRPVVDDYGTEIEPGMEACR
ncbi:MAG: hypothetical protein AAGA37_13805 [Actinomycetota bacterium]